MIPPATAAPCKTPGIAGRFLLRQRQGGTVAGTAPPALQAVFGDLDVVLGTRGAHERNLRLQAMRGGQLGQSC